MADYINQGFKDGDTLAAQNLIDIEQAIINNQTKINQHTTAINNNTQNISGLQEALNSKANASAVEEQISSLSTAIAARGTGLRFDDSSKKLYMTFSDDRESEGVTVGQDLSNYPTRGEIEDLVDTDGKTVSQYVADELKSVDIGDQLDNYYTQDEINNGFDIETIDVDEKADIILTLPNGQTRTAVITKTAVSEYYTARKITKDPFSFVTGNNLTPQAVEYQTGHWSNKAWESSIYYEKWTIKRLDGTTISTTTRTNRFVEIGSEAKLRFEFIPYVSTLINNDQAVIELGVYTSSNYENAVATLSWEIQKVDFNIKATYPNPQKCGSTSIVSCEIPAGVEKTLVLYVDDYEKERVTPNINANRYQFELTSNSHGERSIRIEMIGKINGGNISATPSYGSAIWYDESNPLPILGINKTSYQAKQYDEVLIDIYPFAYFDGADNHNLNLKLFSTESGNEQEELILDDTATSGVTYSYKYEAETKNDNFKIRVELTNSYGSAEKELTFSVTDGDYDFTPVKGETFAFLPKKYSNNSFSSNGTLTISEGVTLTLGDNFNLNSGGFGKDKDRNGNSCFKIPVFNRVYISGREIFNQKKDMHFKIVFQTKNVRQNKATFLRVGSGLKNSFVPSAEGFTLTSHSGQIKGSAETIANSVFTPDSIIDYAFNIVNPQQHANNIYTKDTAPDGYREGDYIDLTLAKYMIMPYEDGVATLPEVYSDLSLGEVFNNVGNCIEIGSDECDVYIYGIKCYDKALGIDDICTNYIADGPSLSERRERFRKNSWTASSNNILKNPKLAMELMEDVKIVLITASQFTNDKSNKIGNTYVQVLQKKAKDGNTTVSNTPYNWISPGCTHSGQGTSSNEYGFAGRNLTIITGDSIYQGATEIFTGTTLTDFNKFIEDKQLQTLPKSELRIKPNTKPVDTFNIKVNIASSENQNNALMAQLYDKLNNEIYKRPAKLRDSQIKDTMNFDNCVIYIRETSPSKADRREFQVDEEGMDSGWHFYGIGNFGDHKDTDITRLDHVWNNSSEKWEEDKLETIVEITDYDVSLCGFNYEKQQNGKEPFGGFDQQGQYVSVERENYPTFEQLLKHKTNLSLTDQGEHYGYYKWDSDKSKYKFEGFGVASVHETAEKDGVIIHSENIECSYEFRYEHEDITLLERDGNIEIWNDFYSKIYPIYTNLRSVLNNPASTPAQKQQAVIDAKNSLSEYMIVDSAILYYLFTERFSLIDNRAKNSFWHYSKKFYLESEVTKMPESLKQAMKDAGMIDNTKADASHHNGYRWDLCFGYDFDTCLGIDNVGALAFEYGQETKDRIFRTDVYYLDDELNLVHSEGFNYFFELIQDFGFSELSSKFSKVSTLLNSSGDGTIKTWDEAQRQFPEKLWLRDIERKYIRPSGDFQVDGSITNTLGDPGYLEDVIVSKKQRSDFLVDKANGLKRYHRIDFEKKQSLYIASRWTAGGRDDKLTFRFDGGAGAPGSITVGFMQKCYYSYATDSEGKSWREPILNQSIYGEKDFSASTIEATGEYLFIYPASELAVLKFPDTYTEGRLTVMETELALDGAPKLSEISFGTKSSSQRPAIGFSNTAFENCTMLKKLDITNCRSYNGDDAKFSIFLTNNLGFEELKAENSALGRVAFAPNGMLKTAILNNNIENISLINPYRLQTLTIPANNKITSLRLENCPSAINTLQLITSLMQQTPRTLNRLRLIGIDWTTEIDTTANDNFIDQLGALAGIDENGNNIDKNEGGHGGSVLSGKIHVYKISTRKETSYKTWWDEKVAFTRDEFVEEVSVSFYNYNPKTERDDLLITTIWTEPGSDITIIENPEKAPTKELSFTFRKWDKLTEEQQEGTDLTVFGNLDFTAEYDTDIRKYNLHWMLDEDTPILVNDAPYITQIAYGQGAIYNGPTPTKASNNLDYPLFSGWSQYIYRPEPLQTGIDENDKPIYSNDIMAIAEFTTGKSGTLEGATYMGLNGVGGIANINAICLQTEKQGDLAETVFAHGDTIDLTIGWDPDDDPRFNGSRKIFDLFEDYVYAYKLNGTGEQVKLTAPLVLNHKENGYYYIDTGLKLCDTLWGEGDEQEFTIVMDYQFIDNEVENADSAGKEGTKIEKQYLLDCSQTQTKAEQRLQLYRDGNGFYFHDTHSPAASVRSHMGSTKQKLKEISVDGKKSYESWSSLSDWSSSEYERIIIRKKKGSRILTVVRANPTRIPDEMSYKANLLPTGAIKYEVQIEGTAINTNTLLLGCKNTLDSEGRKNTRCNCSINNLKVWPQALSDAELEKMSIAPKETITLQLVHFPKKLNSGVIGGDGKVIKWYKKDNDTAATILVEMRDYLKNHRGYVGTTYDNNSVPTYYEKPMGWNNSEMKRWLNERIFNALPQIWQSAIKQVKVYGQNSENETLASDNKLFVLSYSEYKPGASSAEGTSSPIFSGTDTIIKFTQIGDEWYSWYNRTRTVNGNNQESPTWYRINESGGFDGDGGAGTVATVGFAFCI